MEISEHIAAIERDGTLMAAAARRAGLRAEVPPCRPWQVRDLLRHQGYVHRWAARFVAEELREPVAELTEAQQLASGPADDGLPDWFAAGYQALAETLRTADLSVQCWTFLPAPSPLAFWSRRQAHETAIHRADAELAGGAVTPFPPDFAADGIDELIMGFFGRRPEDAAGRQPTLRIVAADADREWLVTLAPDGSRVARAERGGPRQRPDCTLTGTASALYLLLWNRADSDDGDVTVEGAADLVKSWPDSMRVTWG
jgi:uncharacterized protein (TIGR03083 family)